MPAWMSEKGHFAAAHAFGMDPPSPGLFGGDVVDKR
jgi:hypothetical protein